MSSTKKVKGLRKRANALQKKIDEKLNPDRLQNTPRRARMAAAAMSEGRKLQREQRLLRALADGHEFGTIHPLLEGIQHVTELRALWGRKDRGWPDGRSYPPLRATENRLVKIGLTPETLPVAVEALKALDSGGSQADAHADRLASMRRDLVGVKIPGYFPTPDEVISRMVEVVGLSTTAGESGVRLAQILEPSCGDGRIMAYLRDECGINRSQMTGIEVNRSLFKIAQAEGFNVHHKDFMDIEPSEVYDFVLMNPPFENQQDMRHVRRAYKWLRPGGKLVAVMSEGPFFRTDNATDAFQYWLGRVGAQNMRLPDGSFKGSGTGVNTRLVWMTKKAGLIDV